MIIDTATESLEILCTSEQMSAYKVYCNLFVILKNLKRFLGDVPYSYLKQSFLGNIPYREKK